MGRQAMAVGLSARQQHGLVRGWILVVLAVGAIVVGGGWLWVSQQQKVATVRVERGIVVKAFYATGTVRPDVEYVLKSKVQGAVVELAVREGREVEQGQLLARIDDKQLKNEVERRTAELKEAQAQAADDAPQRTEIEARLKEARGQWEICEREVQRVEKQFETRNSSIADVDAARRLHVQWANTIAALESQLGTWKIQSRKNVEVALANLRKAEADMGDTQVRSPVQGIVLERYVEQGEVVGINQQLLLVAQKQDKLMKAAVDEEYVARAFVGQKVEMQLYAFSEGANDRPMVGHVLEILPTANPSNKTYEVKVKFDDPPAALRVGMTAELNFIEDDGTVAGQAGVTKSLVVPTTAIMDGKVYKEVGGRFVATAVVAGTKTLEKTEIREGLKEGDVIVQDAKQVAPVKLPKQDQPVVPTRKGDVADKV